MAKALERGVIDNVADAGRLETVYRVTPEVLMEDDRVQAAYRAFAQHVELTDLRLYDSLLCVEMAALVTLVRELGISQYRWLPGALFWQFCRVCGTDAINVELPKDVLAELDRGHAPKHGATHNEDLTQDIRWWYLANVKRPRVPKRELGRQYVERRRAAGVHRTSEAAKDVRDGIQRAETLMACIDVPKTIPPA